MGVTVDQARHQRAICQPDKFRLRVTGGLIDLVDTGRAVDSIVFDDNGVILQYCEALVNGYDPVGL